MCQCQTAAHRLPATWGQLAAQAAPCHVAAAPIHQLWSQNAPLSGQYQPAPQWWPHQLRLSLNEWR